MEALGAYVRLYNALKIKGPVSWRIEVYKESYQISTTLEAKHHTRYPTCPSFQLLLGGVWLWPRARSLRRDPHLLRISLGLPRNQSATHLLNQLIRGTQ